jgi:hypothetical protein
MYVCITKFSGMEIFHLDNNINVFYVQAESFPNGVLAAHQKLRKMLPNSKDRNFFGISYNSKDGIVYKAAVEESFSGEAEKYGCKKFIIPQGDYLAETLRDWRKDERLVGNTFRQLLSDPRLDKNSFCLEIYLNETDMRCLVKIV